ncbi:MAG TPA: DUF4132 domain-containing protein [Pseudomonas sp.]|nr:DUF4132 domain-containing protein [Pseudomonas sp.]
MLELDTANASLGRLLHKMRPADFAQLLVERMRTGKEGTVAAFFLQSEYWEINLLNALKADAPWWHDHALWQKFSLWAGLGGVLLHCESLSAPGSKTMSLVVQTLARELLAAADQEQSVAVRRFVLWELFAYFWYEGMPRWEIFELIDWAVQIRQAAGLSFDTPCSTDWQALIKALTDTADLQAVARKEVYLCKDVLKEYEERTQALPAKERWEPWHDFFASHPEHYDLYPIQDPELIAIRWAQAEAEAERRIGLAESLLGELRYSKDKHGQQIFIRLAREDSRAFVELLSDSSCYCFGELIAQAIWQEQFPELLPLMLPLIATQRHGDFRGLIHQILGARPDDLLRVSAAGLLNLLPLLEVATFKASLPHLATVVAGSSSKALRETLADCAKKLAPGDFAEAGWLKHKAKNLQLAYRDILLTHPDPAAGPLLAELLAAGRLDAAAASTVQAHLQKLGLLGPVTTAGAAVSVEESLSALEAQAAKVKRIAATVGHFEAADFLGQLQPLSEHAVRVVFHLAATAEAALPPLAEQLLAQVPAEQQARLALAVVHSWIAQDGDPKLRWALKLLPGRSDDRMVDALTAAVMAWGKTKKQRAVIAVEQLGELDSPYALARVQEITTSKKVKDMVHSAARETLIAAAARRKLSVAELCDELTPDFGLGQGLTLNVGERIYRVLLQGDLSLRVVDERGKASKSLPANKGAADQDAWETVNSQFKTLAAALKAVLKQQGPRMEAAFVTGKTWPLERWQRLFLHHPLLRSVGRSLIWQVQGAGSSFRIAEDFSLLDVEDNVLSLPLEARIGLWHPVTAEAGEAEAWKSNLADYELEPLVDQFGACTSLPEPEQFKDDHLLAPAGLVVPQGKLAGVLAKCGYRAVLGDSSIYQHEWRLPSAELCIRLQHSTYMHFMVLDHLVTLEQFEVYDTANGWARLNPTNLPKPLLATLMGQLQMMAAKAAV